MLSLAPGSSARVDAGGLLAFERYDCTYADPGEDCYYEIFSVRVDGGSPRLLTRGDPEGEQPSWSPNGRRIAFENICDVWSMKADGSDQRPLVVRRGDACYGEPAWSPRGTKIVFTDLAVFTVNANGTGRRRLASGDDPAWSPDSRRIAFAYGPTLKVMNADGSGIRSIGTATAPDVYSLAWSPDGQRIAFRGTAFGLYVANVDGSGQKRVAPKGEEPTWSPDGRKIAYVRESYGPLVVMNADGSQKRTLVKRADEPAWSPDGTRIAFAGGGDDDIHVIDADGTHQRTVVKDGESPVWQP